MQDAIEKQIVLAAPISRVWRALTDYRQFGEWFRVDLGVPFIAGEPAQGQILHPGFEHLTWRVQVVQIEPERLFSFTWHPHAADPYVDYSSEEPTLVEFRLEPVPDGTLLSLRESGFENVPAARRDEAFLRNDGGWIQQMRNIESYIAN